MRVLWLFAVGPALLLAGCGTDADSDVGAHGATDCNEGRYFLFRDPDWKVGEAIDYPGELTVAGPPIDWYAEYERMTPISGGARGDSLVLTGHPISLDAFREEVGGWAPEQRTVQGLRGFAGPSPGGSPTIVAVAVDGNYTVGVVSYGLDVQGVIDVAAKMDRMCQPEWLSAGGRTAQCLPTDGSCTSTTTSSTPTTTAPMPTPTTDGT